MSVVYTRPKTDSYEGRSDNLPQPTRSQLDDTIFELLQLNQQMRESRAESKSQTDSVIDNVAEVDVDLVDGVESIIDRLNLIAEMIVDSRIEESAESEKEKKKNAENFVVNRRVTAVYMKELLLNTAMIVTYLSGMQSSLKTMAESMTSIDNLERAREDEALRLRTLAALEGIEKNTEPEPKEHESERPKRPKKTTAGDVLKLGVLGTTVAGLSGIISGAGFGRISLAYKFVGAFAKTLIRLGKSLTAVFRSPAEVTAITEELVTVAKGDSFLSRIVKGIRKFAGRIRSAIGRMVAAVVDVFIPRAQLQKLKTALTELTEFTTAAKEGGIFAKLLTPIKTLLNKGKTFFRFFGASFKFGMAVFERVFALVTLVKGLWNGIKNFVDALDQNTDLSNAERILIAIGAGALELGKTIVNDLLFGLLDLVKDGVSWIADKLGFANYSDALDSFSFVDIFNTVLDGITNWLTEIFAKIINFFKNPDDSILYKLADIDPLSMFRRNILQQILPRYDKNGKWYSLSNLISSAIPNSVYEYAGIDKGTGNLISKTHTRSGRDVRIAEDGSIVKRITNNTGERLMLQQRSLDRTRARYGAAIISAPRTTTVLMSGGNKTETNIGQTAIPDRVGSNLDFTRRSGRHR